MFPSEIKKCSKRRALALFTTISNVRVFTTISNVQVVSSVSFVLNWPLVIIFHYNELKVIVLLDFMSVLPTDSKLLSS